MPSLGGYFDHIMQRLGTQIMEMLCKWNSFVAFHAGEVQATCAISSAVDLQNLLGTTLHIVLRVVFNLKVENQADATESPPQQTAEEPNEDSVSVVIVACLAATRVQHCWLQPCSRQDPLRLGCSEAEARAGTGNQSWERAEEAASERSCPRVARQQQLEDLFN